MSDSKDHPIDVGTRVAWNWGGGSPEGHVTEMHAERVTKEIAGKEITRVGSEEEPALFIERDDSGKNPVLKKATEVHVLGEDEEHGSKDKVTTQRQQKIRDE